jgi:hypothetical protein
MNPQRKRFILDAGVDAVLACGKEGETLLDDYRATLTNSTSQSDGASKSKDNQSTQSSMLESARGQSKRASSFMGKVRDCGWVC